MDILNQIIKGLGKEEIRHFKLMAKRMHNRKDRKDLELFDYIRKVDVNYDDAEIFKRLYSGEDKNSFYRLKNRLIEDVNESLLLLHYRKDEVLYIYHLLSLVRFYISKNQFQLALRFIKKAEAEAESIEAYELLEIIYGEYIKLSHEILSIDPVNYIKRRKEMRSKLKELCEMDDVLAAVSYRLKITQNVSEKDSSVLKLLEKTINDFSNNKEIQKSPLLRFKLYRAVSQVLLQRHDFVSLEKYLLTTYNSFIEENLFNKNNHDTKLQMLTYIVNSLFKNDKNKLSLEYVDKLKLAMAEFNNILKEKYRFFYYNSLVINYSVLDKEKAITILEELKENKKLTKASFYDIFIYLNLAILWFDKENYQNAIRNINKLYIHDGYKGADETLKFKICIVELIIRFELNDFDLLELKIGQLKKDFKQLLKTKEHQRESTLVSIIEQMTVVDSIKRNKKLLEKVKLFVKKGTLNDTEIINYNNWLRSKY